MKAFRRTTAILAACVFLGACDTSAGSKQQMGQLLGAGGGGLLGGVLGNAFGGHNRGLATAIGATGGAALGFMIGGAIGSRLDEQDRQQAENAAYLAVTTGSSRSWHSDHSGNSGRVTVQRSAGNCRLVHETAYIKGEEVVQNAKYCRNADGQWVSA
jgi:surface antigen